MDNPLAARHQQLQSFVGPDARISALAGGDTCDAWLVEDRGERFFLKTNSRPGPMFECEAVGLAAMAATATVRLPLVHTWGDDFLLLEYIAPGSEAADYWHSLAANLAALHRCPQPDFGFSQDNYCGASRQPNPPDDNGYRFFIHQRLLYQGEMASDNGLLDPPRLARLESLCGKLAQLVPPQAPALLHGDLWSGNYFAGADGSPVLVDPATYRGWPEADLAMMTLFGAPPGQFFDCYIEHNPLEPGFEARFPVYNLYHLLNHLNLFGRSYLAGVDAILDRYS